MSMRLTGIEGTLDPELVGELAAALQPLHPPPERMAALKQRVLAKAVGVGSARQGASGQPAVRAAVQPWIEVAPGVRRKDLWRNENSWAHLFQMDPGASFAPHLHQAGEESFCLQGEVIIEGPGAPLLLGEGDFHFAARGQQHGRLFSRSGCLFFVRHDLRN